MSRARSSEIQKFKLLLIGVQLSQLFSKLKKIKNKSDFNMILSVAGDFCITEPYLSDFLMSEDIFGLFKHSDLNVLNLECPVSNLPEKNKIIKIGPHLQASEKIFEHLRALNINAVTLANNHVLDYGVAGLEATISSCQRNNIGFVGAGENIAKASEPTLLEFNGLHIALVNFCENEWSVASSASGGANPLDIIENLKQIRGIRKKVDFVIVIFHGGHEYYPLPSPRMKKQCRFFAENGADAVICHHSHCISGYEVYNDTPIFYGLGNFLFTLKNNNSAWYRGLIVQLSLEKGKKIEWELSAVEQSDLDFQVKVLKGSDRKTVLDEVDDFSKIICSEKDLVQYWDEFISHKSRMLNIFSPLNAIPGKYLRAGLFRLGANRILMREKMLVQVLNYIRCEAHSDLIIELLNRKIKKT